VGELNCRFPLLIERRQDDDDLALENADVDRGVAPVMARQDLEHARVLADQDGRGEAAVGGDVLLQPPVFLGRHIAGILLTRLQRPQIDLAALDFELGPLAWRRLGATTRRSIRRGFRFGRR
jgi:hypothetical protein